MRALPILQTIPGGGSGFGLSYWESWLGCGKKVVLEAGAKKKNDGTKVAHFEVGTVYHALQELYLKRGKRPLDLAAIEFSQVVDEKERLEGERLFRAYRGEFDADDLGKMITTEETAPKLVIERDNSLLIPIVGPYNQEIEEACGVWPLTIKPDAVNQLNARDVRRLRKDRRTYDPHKALRPGYWIIDHKTAGGEDTGFFERFMNSWIFVSQPVVWNIVHPKRPVLGCIVNAITKDKTPSFHRVVIPFPNAERIAGLKQYLQLCKRHRDVFGGQPKPSEMNCFPKFGTCRWYLDGLCKRV